MTAFEAAAHRALLVRGCAVMELWESSGVWAKSKELIMKQLAFAVGLLAVGFVAATPARADYAVVQFGDGYCRIWWDSLDNPWGSRWSKIAIGLPDQLAAQAALDTEISQGVCR